jgi:hypothetical protein
MTTTRKSIAIAIDAAADRASAMGAYGATKKQVWFLAGLIEEAGRDASDIGCQISNTTATLTKKEASRYIEDYLSDKHAKAA